MHHLLTRVVHGVRGDALVVCARQNVETAVALRLQVLRAVHASHVCLLVLLLKLLAAVVLLVIARDQVVGRASVVLLAGVEVVSLSLQDGLLARVIGIPISISLDFAFIALLTQVGVRVLLLFEFLLANFLVSHGKVLVEAVALYTNI